MRGGQCVAIIGATIVAVAATTVPASAVGEPRIGLVIAPSSVGANAGTTLLVTGSGFAPTDKVTISGCPTTNPGAVYPVPFPNPGPGQGGGSVEFVDSTRVLVTTPTIIPAGTCNVTVGDTTAQNALTFVVAPERLQVEIVNDSGRPDAEVWVSVGYNCPLSMPSPPYPPGVGGCDTDGRSNPHYDWPATSSGKDQNRYWYEVYAGATPLPAFTGRRLTDLARVDGRPHAYALSVANIDSGVVYVSYGEAVQTGASVNGRAPSYLASPTRFDVFELTFHGSGASAGNPGAGSWTNRVYANITAVAGLGILMDMTGYDNSRGADGPAPQRIGTGIRWEPGLGIRDVYAGLAAAGADVTNQRVVVTTDGRPATPETFLRFVSPSTNEGVGYADLGSGPESYLRWIDEQGHDLTVVGLYTGAGPGQGTWFCYRAERFHHDAPTTLRGSYGHASKAAAATAAMNDCAGGTRGLDVTTATTPTSGVPGPVTSQAVYMQDNRFLQGGAVATGNDLYNAIYRDFIVSFAYGYWGSLAGNAGWITTSWSQGQAPAFALAWPGMPDAKAHPRWSAYAESIWRVGNAYGMPYSDTFENAGKGNPLVSGSSIHTLRVTLRDDGAWSDAARLLPKRQRVIATRGERFASAPLQPVGFGAGVRYTITPALPTRRSQAVNGIWFVPRTGVITGTPKRVAQVRGYTIVARDTAGTTASARIRLLIRP